MKTSIFFLITTGYMTQSLCSGWGWIFDPIAPEVPQSEIWAVQNKARDMMNGIFLGGIMQYFKEYKTEYKKCYDDFLKRYNLVADVFIINMRQCGETINKALPEKYLNIVNHLRGELKSLAASTKEYARELEKMVEKGKFENVNEHKNKWCKWGFDKYNNFYADMLRIRKHKKKIAEELIDDVNFHRNQTSDFAWAEAQGLVKCIKNIDKKS